MNKEEIKNKGESLPLATKQSFFATPSPRGTAPKTPNIRFAGFSDAWQEKKFSDFGSVAMCKRIFKEETSEDEEIPFFKIGTFGKVPDTFISRKKFEEYKRKYSYPQKGDILISASGTIGRTVEFDGQDAYFQDSNIIWLKHNNTIENSFLKILYENVKWNGIEGSTIQRLYNDNFLKTHFFCSSLPEQQKIGQLFSNIDALIAQEQKKSDSLINVKKSLLNKMFPAKIQNDEFLIPCVRFAGFCDPWQEKKLGDVADYKKGNGYSKKDLKSSGSPIILYGRLYTNYETIINDIDTFVDEQKNSVKSIGGDVIIPASGETAEDIARASVVSEKDIILGGDLNILNLKKSYNSEFTALLISNGKVQKELSKKAQGKSVVHIHNYDIQALNVSFPSLPEQRKIGQLFSKLDSLIKLQNKKVIKLKNIKMAMLKKMFC